MAFAGFNGNDDACRTPLRPEHLGLVDDGIEVAFLLKVFDDMCASFPQEIVVQSAFFKNRKQCPDLVFGRS